MGLRRAYGKKSLLLTFISICFSPFLLFSGDRAFLSLGYSPGITDNIRTDIKPRTHTYEQVPLAINLKAVYMIDQNAGAGLDINWGSIKRIIIKNGSSRYVSEDWSGTYSQLYISPQFDYIPFRLESGLLQIGIGPCVTMNFYSSEYGNSFDSAYCGISLSTRYNYFIRKNVFLQGGFRFTVDFIEIWDAELFSDFVRFQYYPVLGLGMRF